MVDKPAEDTTVATEAATLSGLLAVISLLGGDAAMIAVVATVRQLVDGVGLQLILSSSVVAVAGYYLIGLPQIVSWESATGSEKNIRSHRTRMGLRVLERPGVASFVLASLIGGPLIIGFITGLSKDRMARRKTLIASCIMAICWSAIYLGLIQIIVQAVSSLAGGR